jgi:muconate cycloisomerase
MLATAEAAGLPVVIGHGFGLDPSTLAEVMLAASSRNVLPGLECVGLLKVGDTVATARLDISKGSLPLPTGRTSASVPMKASSSATASARL